MSNATAFRAGFASRQAGAADLLARAMSPAPAGFAAVSPGGKVHPFVRRDAAEAQTAATPASGPRHFSPADPDVNPTEGWDPLDPSVAQPEPALAAEAIRKAAFADGFAEGLNQGRARDDALLADVAAALAGRIDRDRLADGLRATVLALVTRLVGEAGVSADLLTERVRAAADLLASENESAILRVHPDDVGLLVGRVADTVFPVGDANVERGAFVLESQTTVVEDGPALWLRQLGEHLERLGVPA